MYIASPPGTDVSEAPQSFAARSCVTLNSDVVVAESDAAPSHVMLRDQVLYLQGIFWERDTACDPGTSGLVV